MGILWARSTSIEFDGNGDPAAGAKAYFYQGGTTTPLVVYQDAAATTPHTSPVVANSIGRWPSVFIPYIATYDVKATTSGGTQLFYPTNIANPDPVTAAENTVDVTQLISTGDIIWSPVNATRAGFVRANGRTIGSAASSATERANDDTIDLYEFLWNNIANASAAVTGGRGGSAAADFAANKPIALLDMRGGGPLGLDDMGATDAATLSPAFAAGSNGSTTTPGSLCGENAHALTIGQLAAHVHGSSALTAVTSGAHTHTGTSDGNNRGHTHSGTTATQNVGHTHSYGTAGASDGKVGGLAAGSASGNIWFSNASGTTGSQSADHTHTVTTGDESQDHSHSFTTASGGGHTHTISGNTDSEGADTAHNNVSKSVLGTWFQKL